MPRSRLNRFDHRAGLARAMGLGALALVAAGCSAEVVRSDAPSLAVSEDGKPPRPPEGMRSDLGASSLVTAETTSQTTGRTETAALPPASPAPTPEETDRTIEVQAGDTLYGVAQRHRVSVSELKAVNGLAIETLRPGQKLKLPSTASRRERVAAERKPKPPKATPPANWNDSYAMKAGDSLYVIAKRRHVKLADLQRFNGIDDPRRIRPGTVLRVPKIKDSTIAVARVRTEDPVNPTPRVVPTEQHASIRPVETDRVAPSQTADATPADARDEAPVGKLRWPVRGKIVGGYGPRGDGTQNDGVNIAVPMGAEVHAAEAGTVAYAGDELPGYGNLVLVRHDNGWVTAYAHNSEVVVARGDTVMRGQVIAKAGNSGRADQPQVHFELRRDSKPIDPTPFME